MTIELKSIGQLRPADRIVGFNGRPLERPHVVAGPPHPGYVPLEHEGSDTEWRLYPDLVDTLTVERESVGPDREQVFEVGDPVHVIAFAKWRPGHVVKVMRTRAVVRYASRVGGREERAGEFPVNAILHSVPGDRGHYTIPAYTWSRADSPYGARSQQWWKEQLESRKRERNGEGA